MARTSTKMKISDLPVESMEEKCNRYFKVTGSIEDDTKKLIHKYLNMLTSADIDAEENKRQGEENAEMVKQNKENAGNTSKNNKSKTVKPIKKEDAKKNGTKFKRITKEERKIKGKVMYFVTKLKTTHYSETLKNTLKQRVLAEPQTRQLFVDIIIASKDTYLKDKLRNLIEEMNEEAENVDTPTTSKVLVNTENNNQPNTPDMSASFSDNKINGKRSTMSKDSPDSREDPPNRKSPENKKRPKTSKTPKSFSDNDSSKRRSLRLSTNSPAYFHSREDPTNGKSPKKQLKTPKKSKSFSDNDSGRRRSLRLSTNPPGYFQTKPAMVIYIIPNDSSQIKRKSSSNKKLTNTIPKAKRRKLYNANSI